MRIGIDIKCLRTNKSGIGKYLQGLLDVLQKIDFENEYFLFSPTAIDYKISNPNFKLVIDSFSLKIPGILWQQFRLPFVSKKYRLNYFWGPEQTIPLWGMGKTKTILTLHDFVYRRYPETMRTSVRLINKFIGEKSIEKANLIFANSNFTKKELEFFHEPIQKQIIQVVPCGIPAGENNSSCEIDYSKREFQMLFAGSMEPRKNLSNLIYALEILQKKGINIPLVMTGQGGWKNKAFKEQLEKSPVKDNVRHLGYVSEPELHELYEKSLAVVFPSLYEGFGMPIIEALSKGTPVLTSKDSVMNEIAGDFAFYFDPKSPESIALALQHFIENQELYFKEMNSKLKERNLWLSSYTWENSAKKFLEILSNYNESPKDCP